MAQKKKTKKQPPKDQKKRISRSQRVMVVIGILIILSMISGSIMSLVGTF
jgi:cell division protein FtsL